MNDPWETIETLVVVRTYPAPSRQNNEISCTAGITRDGGFVRLYPVPYRLLDVEKRFHKWQWISVRVRATPRDPRPESRRIDEDSIEILSEPLSTGHQWVERRRIVMPLKAESMCGLRKQRDRDGSPTMGFIRPLRIERLRIEPIPSKWSAAELGRLRQNPLWGKLPPRELQKIPFKFSYQYACHSVESRTHSDVLRLGDGRGVPQLQGPLRRQGLGGAISRQIRARDVGGTRHPLLRRYCE